MKVKLLKKLRKLAKKEYWLEDHKSYEYRYWVCNKDYYIKSFSSYKEALEELTWRRRAWILNYIESRRNYKLNI